jgi:hypothetical protein
MKFFDAVRLVAEKVNPWAYLLTLRAERDAVRERDRILTKLEVYRLAQPAYWDAIATLGGAEHDALMKPCFDAHAKVTKARDAVDRFETDAADALVLLDGATEEEPVLS